MEHKFYLSGKMIVQLTDFPLSENGSNFVKADFFVVKTEKNSEIGGNSLFVEMYIIVEG